MDSSIIPTPNGTQSHPWLVLFEPSTKGQQKQVFYSLLEGRYHSKKNSEMHNKRILTNRKDWLLMVYFFTNECCILNVVSMEKVKLPKLESHHFNYRCPLLTSPPGDPDCHVIFLKVGIVDHFSLCQPGDDKFIDKEILLPEDEEEDTYLRWATIFNGSIYGVGNSAHSLFRANLNDPTLQFQTVLQGESIQNYLLDDHHQCYLIESCGELLLVIRYFLHDDISNFQVFRADFSTLKWVLLTSIGDRAIFLQECSSHGLSCSVSEFDQIQGNSIYYTEHRSRLLYVFNLENRSFTSFLPCPTNDSKKVIRQWIIIPQTSVSCDYSKS